MKKIAILILFWGIALELSAIIHFNSCKYTKEQDFFLNVLANPNADLFTLLSAGFSLDNTELKQDDNIYYNSEKIRNLIKKEYGYFDALLFHDIYEKIRYSWSIFIEVQNYDWEEMKQYVIDCSYGPDNIYVNRRRSCPNPILRDKLKIIPLKVTNEQRKALINQEENTKRIFSPMSATIIDDNGTFTSENFNCPSMAVIDNKTSIDIYWNNDRITLHPSSVETDTYYTSQTQYGIQLSFTAYRSSLIKKIYLVTVKRKTNSEIIVINFKP